jgi:hypothetical protein
MKTSVIRALEKGIMTSTKGVSSIVCTVLADHMQLPIMAFSKRGVYWDRLWLKRIPVECFPQIKEWWNVDRVTFRIDNPEKAMHYLKSAYYKSAFDMPSWLEKSEFTTPPIAKIETSLEIFSNKNLELFDAIAKHYTKTEEYQEKIKYLIPLIKDGSTITIKQNWRV